MKIILGHIREAELEDTIRYRYCPSAALLTRRRGHKSEHIHSLLTGFDSEQSTGSVKPLMTPAYSFGNAKGFGPWQLLLSGETVEQLKIADREGLFQTMILKLRCVILFLRPSLTIPYNTSTTHRIRFRDLSKGKFSLGDNQKRLSIFTHGVPIFQATLNHEYSFVVCPLSFIILDIV